MNATIAEVKGGEIGSVRPRHRALFIKLQQNNVCVDILALTLRNRILQTVRVVACVNVLKGQCSTVFKPNQRGS